MNQIIIFLIGAVVGGVIVWFSKKSSLQAPSPRSKDEGQTRGIKQATMQAREEKAKRKERILTLLSQKEEISNNDIEELLGVSDATATNYLQELENEGKIEQIGQEGRGVRYRAIS